MAADLETTPGHPPLRERSPRLVICTTAVHAPQPARRFENARAWDGHPNVLLDCLRASCHIPPTYHPFDHYAPWPGDYVGYGRHYGNDELMDGAISDFQPCVPGLPTVKVCPFAGTGFDIAPQDTARAWAHLSVPSAVSDADSRSERHTPPRIAASLSNLGRVNVAVTGAPQSHMQTQLEAGYKDARRYLQSMGLFLEDGGVATDWAE